MRLTTHITFGAACHAAVTLFARLPLEPAGLVVAGVAASLADVDTMGSTVGRALPWLSRPIERRWGHRTATHSYACQALVALACLPLWLTHPHLYVALVVGYASHPFLDTMTVQGVRLFWPLSDRRCVFPYFARQPLRYRTRTGSKADAMIGLVCALCLVPLALLHAEGYERFVRRLQGDVAAAVRDVTDWGEAGFLAYVDVEAASAQTGQQIRGRYEVLGPTAPDVLVVRPLTSPDPPIAPPDRPIAAPPPGSPLNPTTQPANSPTAPADHHRARPTTSPPHDLTTPFTLGPHYSAHFQVRRITAVRGPRVQVRRFSVDLAGRSLADLAVFIPVGPDGRPVRHLVEGSLQLAETAHVAPDPSHYPTVEASGTTLTLSFATLADLERAGLDGRVATSGTVDVRLFLPAGQAERYGVASVSKRRTVTAPYAPGDAPRLVLRVGSIVARGDTLAVLHAAEVAEAEADLADARQVAAALVAQQPQDAIETARDRAAAAEARAALERLQKLAREGYAPEGAARSAAAALGEAEARLAAQEAQSLARREAFTARLVEAEARVRRARLALDKLRRTSAITAPAAGRLARVDTLRTSTARHELRLHIE